MQYIFSGAVLQNVFQRFADLLKSSSVIRQDAALRCLEVLLHRRPEYWQPLQDAGAVQPLVSLLQSNKRRPKSAQGDTGTRHFIIVISFLVLDRDCCLWFTVVVPSSKLFIKLIVSAYVRRLKFLYTCIRYIYPVQCPYVQFSLALSSQFLVLVAAT